jgi:tetratricopeptide (TPR) repeat protein
LQSTLIDKNELIDCCKNEYEENKTELKNLRDFQQNYLSNKALWWYTRESFFYKTLNGALRTKNIHMIFLFRRFISDIYRQLKYDQVKSPLRVYRSQLMSSDELDSLKQRNGQLISINSFFSTSKQRTTALFLLGDTTITIDLERVLFEIDADPKIVTTKPFADISKYSEFTDESEVLFMIGSIFRLNSVYRDDNDPVWIIRMTLCSEEEHDLKQVLMDMKQQIGNGRTNLRKLGHLLWDMGELKLAEKYFNRLLKQLPTNDLLHINLYEGLAKLASQKGDHEISMKWYQKAVTFKEQNQLTTNSNFINANITVGKFIEEKSLIIN